MTVAKNMVISIDYTVTDLQGTELDTSRGSGPFSYIHGTGSVVPGLEAALEGRSIDDRIQVTVSPKDGYGERDESLLYSMPRERLGEIEDLRIGTQFHVRKDSGKVLMLTVTGLKDGTVTVDGNHPLAGTALRFDVTVKDVRAATEEELEHGHAHCGEGHDECGHDDCGEGCCDCGCGQ